MEMFFLLSVGIILGGAIFWLRSKNVATKWYDWVLILLGLFLVIFTIQNFFGSNSEIESTAANLFLLVTGLPALIVLIVAWQLMARRAKA